METRNAVETSNPAVTRDVTWEAYVKIKTAEDSKLLNPSVILITQ
jgi:hypothetical protein